MLKRSIHFLSVLTIFGLFLALMTMPSGSSRVASAQTDDIPQPLDGTCEGVAPLDDPDACCAFGYVYHNDEPIAGATVRIESADATWEDTTGDHGISDEPHYQVDLTTDLDVTPGDEITITVSHNDMVSTRTWTVQPGSQQVDMGLIEGYQASAALSANTAPDQPLKAQTSGYTAVLAGSSPERKEGQAQGYSAVLAGSRAERYEGQAEGYSAVLAGASAERTQGQAEGYSAVLAGSRPERDEGQVVTNVANLSYLDAQAITTDSPDAIAEVKLTASDGASKDKLGRSVSIEQNVALVGAPYDDDKGTSSGSAYTFPEVTVSPASISVTLEEGQSSRETLVITNLGINFLEWETNESAAWLSVSPTNGEILPDEEQLLSVRFDASGLSAGTYTDLLNISVLNEEDPDGPRMIGEVVPVTLVVTPPPTTLTVSKTGTGSGSVTSSPSGINCGTDCSQQYDADTSVTLTASPASDSIFVGWSGGGCTGTGTCVVTMDASKSVTAQFNKQQYSLSVSKSGTGSGTVTSSPSGINCGTDCSKPYDTGTVVTLSASPASDSIFVGWSGGGCSGTGTCTVTMDASKSVTAQFNKQQYSLSVSKSGTGSGTVTSTPSGINCGTDCSQQYDAGTSVTLTASPASDSIFVGWSGGGCTGTSPCTVTMNASKSVTAQFNKQQYSLSVSKSGTGSGTVTSSPSGINCGTDCSQQYAGTSVTLTASPATGSLFVGWSGGGCSGTSPCTVTMNASKSVTAEFTADAPVAQFTATPTSGIAPLNVTFTDQSTGAITSWTWDFGDGNISGARYPAHTYWLPGTYTVSLTVSGPGGPNDMNVKVDYITVNEPTEVNTLILTNRQKITDLHGASAATQLMNKLGELATHQRVQGLVIAVEDKPSVASAYAAWNTNPTSTENANAVTSAIKGVIDAKLASYPDVEYIVVAGDDRVIPFRRVRDQTWYSEKRYCYKMSSDSVTGAALCDDMTLTDDYYADRVPFVPQSHGWDGHETYLPDFGIGRLIETPQEMMAQIDTFLGDDGISTTNAAVTGYTFVTDAAAESCRVLNDAGVATDCTLIGKNWSRDNFINRVLNIPYYLISINAHADHHRFGTPNGTVTSNDILDAPDIHQRAVFYTIGCHAGLNVPPDNPNPLDMAQAFAQKQANYVANTGYGYGYRYSVGLSEQLMINFTKQLTHNQPTTLGQALTAAKQQYYLRDYWFGYYDEKILIESTLYGLPMYEVSSSSSQRAPLSEAALPAEELPEGVIVEEEGIPLDGEFSKTQIRFKLPALTEVITDSGTYYTLGGLIHSEHGEPIQPKLPFKVSVPGTKAHGLVFKGGTYSDISPFDPVIQEAFTLTQPSRVFIEPPFTQTNWYPAILPQLNILDNGAEAQMTALLGQYNSTIAGGTERLYSKLSVDIYYHTDSDDWTAPTITSVSSELATDTATVTVATTDDSGIHEVLVTHTDQNGAWQSTTLTNNEDAWSGTFPATANTDFFVQVVDKAGNVTVDHNNGAYYKFDVHNSKAILVGEVDLQGRAGKPDPRWSVPLRVSLTAPGGSTPAYELTPTTDQNGIFTVEDIEPGSYELRVKHSHTLQKMVNVTLVEGNNNIDVETLFEGDANDDNFVTLPDFAILADAFGTCEGAPNYDARADFNNDGCVTLPDFALLADNFGQGGHALHLSEPTRLGSATNGLTIRASSTSWVM